MTESHKLSWFLSKMKDKMKSINDVHEFIVQNCTVQIEFNSNKLNFDKNINLFRDLSTYLTQIVVQKLNLT